MIKTLLFAILLAISFSVSAERLTDSRGRTIGTTSTNSSGIVTMRDYRGRTTGTFDPRTNTTRDSRGRTIGTGNQLSSTLPERK